MPGSVDQFQRVKYTDGERWEQLRKSRELKLTQMDFSEMGHLKGQLSNRDARAWYLAHDKKIPDMIDYSQPLEVQARQACDLRNQFRFQARELMADQKLRAELDQNEKKKTFEELVQHKMTDKGLSYIEALQDIVKSASKTRKSVNQSLGLE